MTLVTMTSSCLLVDVDDAAAERQDDCMGSIGGAELGQDLVDVGLDGALRNAERVTDRAVGLTLRETGENLELAGGELVRRVAEAEAVGHLHREVGTSRGHHPDSRNELVPLDNLE